MKEQLKNAVAEIEAKLGDLEGFILIALDANMQANYLEGKAAKMIRQLTAGSAEVMEAVEEGIKGAKLDKALKDFLAKAKECGFDPEAEAEENEDTTIS